MEPPSPTTTRRERARRQLRLKRFFVLGFAAALLAVAGAGVWLLRGDDNRLPPGVAIAGLDLGGRTLDEARSLLVSHAAQRVEQPVRLVWAGGGLETSGRALRASAEIEEALDAALGSRDGLGRLLARLGLAGEVGIPLRFSVGEQRLRRVVRRVAAEVERPARPARLEVVGSEIVVRPARAGTAIDRRALAARIALLPASVELVVRERPPAISDEVAERARTVALELVEAPPTIVYRKRRLTFSRARLLRALSFEQAGGAIRVSLDPAELRPQLEQAFGRFEREPRDAQFVIDGMRVRVASSRRGRTISAERIAASLVDNAGQKQVRALFDRAEPGLTTREAERLQIRELVSEFSTPYSCCQPRVTNIQLAASILDGQIIEAGGSFSLNERLGQRTAERGFVAAPQISDGRLEDAIGGGVSQTATTLYNAAFFAGLELVAHTPHQFYISRYPMGREATVSWGGPELIFRNDWPAAILVKVIATDTFITVRFYSSKLGRRVETETGEPHDFRPARVIRELNPELPPGTETVVQSGGVRGFSVEYTRKVYRGKRLLRDERFSVRYDPEDTIVEYGPPVQEQPAETGEQPAETGEQPAETGNAPPAETKPAETKPAETAPAETAPTVIGAERRAGAR